MTISTSVHSNAFNFMSALKSGVDPRTGQYTVSVSLPETQSNDLRGPGIPLTLAFNPLNTEDSGLGKGWSLQLSQYTPRNRVLSLSTGETFKVTGNEGQRLIMKEQKLDSFHFYEQDDGRFRVMHKSGLVEILELRGAAEHRVALPVEICSAQGHKISLSYQTFSTAHALLDSISDASGELLLQVKRNSSSVEILMHPFAAPDGGPLAKCVMTLTGSDSRVSKIELPTEEGASWRFGYDEVLGHTCMTWVESPSGGREDMYYRDSGHRFPTGSGRTALPRVTQHLTDPGLEQAKIDVRFSYPNNEHNFLGGGLSLAWDDDGLDNIYQYTGTYEYGSSESLWVDEKAVRSIERTFNQFHLLTREKTTQNHNVQEVETIYHLIPGARFDDQPAKCQLPKEVITRWSLNNDATRQRSETESTDYDNKGNLLVKTHANGVTETSTWYSVAGADGCPADPEGFVRWLKDKTVTPAPADAGQAPILMTRYRYSALPPLAGSGLANWITNDSETLFERVASIYNELQRTEYSWFDEPNDAFLHGREKSRAVTLNNKTTTTQSAYRKLSGDQTPVQQNVQQSVETLIGFDGAAQVTTQQHGLLTGQLLLLDQDGVEVRYRYDVLGRVIEETESADTDYQATRRYEYSLSSARGRPAEQWLYDAKNLKTYTRLDGLNRVIYEERDDADGGLPKQTYAATYDAWGHLSSESQFDWPWGKELKLTSRFEYDDWDQQCCVIGPDNVELHEAYDPIGSHDWKAPIMRSWRQSPGPDPLISERQVNGFNLFAKPVQERRLSADEKEDDQPLVARTYQYDGLGRCTLETDELKRETRFTYDVWSRMLGTTLPDSTQVTQTYAEHSTAELQADVRVALGDAGDTRVLVGKQTFDGLERRTDVTVGSRTERFLYEGSHKQPSSRITAAGQTIEYDYNPALTDAPVASRAPDEQSSYSYDFTSARLSSTQNPQGSRRYAYNAANQLLAEHWTDNRQQTWETSYVSSLQGRSLQRTDPGGLTTDYSYDSVGRISSVVQGQVLATFDYNRLGQLSQIRCQDKSANSTLVTVLEYDDLGRETLRTQRLGTRPPRSLSQTWKIDGLLDTRHLQENGISLLLEEFSYDQRGRLTTHKCSGTTLPRDRAGREITQQIFTFDRLDNISLSMTTFANSTVERVLFTYAPDDPCRLLSTKNAPQTWEKTFDYDADGNMLNDEQANTLSYDSQGRLLDVSDSANQVISHYRYDSFNQLVSSQRDNQNPSTYFYQGTRLSNILRDNKATAYLYLGEQPLAQQQPDDANQTLLLLTDANHSVLGESQRTDLRTAIYSAYGERSSDAPLLSSLAFNGEVRDEDTGWYLLGQGYRAYNPNLMRFHSPDFLSPFDAGGLNPYTYCLGNPIALRDPTGHAAFASSGRLRSPNEDQLANSPVGGGGNIGSWIGIGVGAFFSALSIVGGIAAIVGGGFIIGGLLLAGGVLGLAGSATSAAGLATNNQTLNEAGMYLGYAATATALPLIAYSAYGAVNAGLAAVRAASATAPLSRMQTVSTFVKGALGSVIPGAGGTNATDSGRTPAWVKTVENAKLASRPKINVSPPVKPVKNTGDLFSTQIKGVGTRSARFDPSPGRGGATILKDQKSAATTPHFMNDPLWHDLFGLRQ